jgi:hypothetical protein
MEDDDNEYEVMIMIVDECLLYNWVEEKRDYDLRP